MEEKNNAVEKVENTEKKTAKKTAAKKPAQTANAKQSSAPARGVKAAKEKKGKREISEKKRARLEKKAERERIRAEKRVALAELREKKQAEHKKAVEARKREKNRRKQEYREKVALKKQERKEKREMLKHETKAQREKRIAQAKAEKARLIREKRELKARVRREKKELALQKRKERRIARENKRKERNRYRQEKRTSKKGYGGWLAAVISLGASLLVVSTVLAMTFFVPTENDITMQNAYRRSFYDTVSYVDNMETELSKVLASGGSEAQQKYLVDLAIDSELAENDLQRLPLQDEVKHYTTKLVNQIGDYSKYLNEKLANGGTVTSEEKESLRALYEALSSLKKSLNEMSRQMGDDFDFSSLKDAGEGNFMYDGFTELENMSVNFPELIYDGPFSDGLSEREPKGLTGEEIDETTALDLFNKYFAAYHVADGMIVGETAGQFPVYNAEGMAADGSAIYAQISKKGGKLLMFDSNMNCEATNFDLDSCVEIAVAFLRSIGIEGMRPVWSNESGTVATINFAYEAEDVIVYSDLVKVKVCEERGLVTGMEASSYYLNHTERSIPAPALTAEEARAKINADIDVITSRLTLIPIGNSSEVLAYEFAGEYEGATYYVYIDAATGKQVELFKVVEGTEGTLLI